MVRIIGTRGIGKTRKLLQEAHENNATVVCNNVKRYVEKAHAYGIVGLNFVSYDEYLSNFDDGDTLYMIDDVEDLLKYLPGTVVGFSCNVEEG